MFSAIRWTNDARLELLDQRRLPQSEVWVSCEELEDVAVAIETMIVRGAPAIATAAAFGLVLAAKDLSLDAAAYAAAIERLGATRPTAVNLFHVLRRFKELGLFDVSSPSQRLSLLLQTAKEVFDEDLQTCLRIGASGLDYARAEKIERPLRVLTHCNTGSLATSGYGTALGVIRSLHSAGLLEKVYVDETRPYLQGSRLTAFELTKDQIPFELITDSMAAFLMQQSKIDWAVVGADRIVANGDTANKIGTYSVAVNAQYHKIPFFVAAPLATFDLSRSSGEDIPIELRSGDEVTHFQGQAIAPAGTKAYNPSFDVTPSSLIAGFFTEIGFLRSVDINTRLRDR